MKLSTSILCAAALAFVGIVCSCEKQNEQKSYSVDLKLSINATDDIVNNVTRQYIVKENDGVVMTYTIGEKNFSETQYLNIVPPMNIDVILFASYTGEVPLPATFNVKNDYEISCTNSKNTVSFKKTDAGKTITQAEISSYVQTELNDTLHFRLNEDGTLSKVE